MRPRGVQPPPKNKRLKRYLKGSTEACEFVDDEAKESDHDEAADGDNDDAPAPAPRNGNAPAQPARKSSRRK